MTREVIPETDESISSPLAAEEEEYFSAARERKEVAEENAFNRNQKWLNFLSHIRVWVAGFGILVIIAVVLLMVWTMVVHYILFEHWRWLNENDLNRIETALTSGAISTLLFMATRVFTRSGE